MTDPALTREGAPLQHSEQDQWDWLEQQVQHLMVAVEHELRIADPIGISELDLIRALQSERWQLIGTVNFMEPDQLYPVHFLLFHSLYRLREQLSPDRESLVISPLRLGIVPRAGEPRQTLPDPEDPLRAFYLDLNQYFMSNDDIQTMMDSFWSGSAMNRPDHTATHRAASTLGFEQPPASFAEVKKQFRRQVMTAHPDRGGSTEDIQQLNHAFSVLKAHYSQG